MIKVEKILKDVPEGLCTQTAKDANLKVQLDFLGKKLSTKSLRSYVYAHQTVIDKLSFIYKNKCAFCETIFTNNTPTVEHYRPKLAVEIYDLSKEKGKKLEDHQGYYWLSYEWNNLLLCCNTCNGHKGNRFNINKELIRVFNKKNIHLLYLEKPLILNPEIDNPDKHLEFLPNGFIHWKTLNGELTCKVVKLNRQGLIGACSVLPNSNVSFERNKLPRFELITSLILEIEKVIEKIPSYESQNFSKDAIEFIINDLLKDKFQQIIDFSKPTHQYSAFGKAMVKDLRYFIENNVHFKHLSSDTIDFIVNRFEFYKNNPI